MEHPKTYRREHYRLPVTYGVLFSDNAVVGEGKVTNLSVFGCTIETPTPVLPDQRLAMRLILPDKGESLPIDVAEVRWANGNKVGVKFVQVERAANVRLHGFIWDRMVERFESLLASTPSTSS
jgi:hypothetical protein